VPDILPYNFLRYQDRWLEAAGFSTGDEVSVRVVKPGELVITLLPEIEEMVDEL
jgi:hypothetical protein